MKVLTPPLNGENKPQVVAIKNSHIEKTRTF
jgi:hypothetical protein